MRENDTDEQKRNREVEAYPTQTEDPFNPYRSTIAFDNSPMQSPFLGDSNSGYGNLSSQALPLVHHAQQPRGHDRDNDSDYDHKTVQSDDEYSTPYTNNNDSASQVGTELYAPSRNMFDRAEKTGLHDKDLDVGEINIPTEGETAEKIEVTPARKKWVFLVWALTWWLPSPLLRWIGGMKRPDIREAWREKLAINMIIWFICGCAVFVIAILGNLICPRQYVYSPGEVSERSYDNNPDGEYVTIRGEVFDVS